MIQIVAEHWVVQAISILLVAWLCLFVLQMTLRVAGSYYRMRAMRVFAQQAHNHGLYFRNKLDELFRHAERDLSTATGDNDGDATHTTHH